MKLNRKFLAGALAATFLSSGIQAMTLTSTDVKNGQPLKQSQFFNGYGCIGKNLSPALKWHGAPAHTQSYAVTIFDPDAPTGSGWWHWMVINIPADVQMLAENAGTQDSKALPQGAMQMRSDFGYHGFGGACPLPKTKAHRYKITVYALDVSKLELPVDASAALTGFYINQHKIDEAQIIAPTAR